EMVKYRPGRRMVVRESGSHPVPTIYWKLYHNARGRRLCATLRELDHLARTGCLRFRVPGLAGSWVGSRAVALHEAEGVAMNALAPPALESAAAETGAALATLHRCGWRPTRTWKLEDEAAGLHAACAPAALDLQA